MASPPETIKGEMMAAGMFPRQTVRFPAWEEVMNPPVFCIKRHPNSRGWAVFRPILLNLVRAGESDHVERGLLAVDAPSHRHPATPSDFQNAEGFHEFEQGLDLTLIPGGFEDHGF